MESAIMLYSGISMFTLIFIYFVLFLESIIFIFKKKNDDSNILLKKNWYTRIFLNREDFLSQSFFLFFYFFFTVTIFVLNKKLNLNLDFQDALFLISLFALYIGYRFRGIYLFITSLVYIIYWYSFLHFTGIVAGIAKGITKNDIIVDSVGRYTGFLYTVILSLILYVQGKIFYWNNNTKRLSFFFRLISISIISVVLFFNSWFYIFENFSSAVKENIFSFPLIIQVILFGLFVLLLKRLSYAFKENMISKSELKVIFIFLLFLFFLILTPRQYLFQKDCFYYSCKESLSSAGFFWFMFFNVFLFVEIVGVIFLGLLNKEVWLVNLGVFLLFVSLVFKYLVWFSSFKSKSLFFIITGIFMILFGWFLEKKRRHLISIIKKDESEVSNQQS